MNDILNTSALHTSAGLFSAETGIDAALAGVAATILNISRDRERAGLPAIHVQTILERGAEAQTALIAARRSICTYHSGLEAQARKSGVDLTAIGVVDKPDQGTFPPPTTPSFARL